MVNFNSLADSNFQLLKKNSYPGRGIIIGKTPAAGHFVQVYWIMGRSENSRNRIFVNDNGCIKTEAFDKAKLKDPSLVIYYATRHTKSVHIVTNGDQTDTIFAALQQANPFESALDTRTYEPDPPNYTPRISGLVDLGAQKQAYKLSILKPVANTPEYGLHQYFNYEQAIPGCGHCIHTYADDGNPLPAFAGEPYLVPLTNKPADIADAYWQALNPEHKVALFVKLIDVKSGEFTVRIVNKLK